MFGEKLKELRESNGLVQRQVAAKLAVDTAYVSKMESNEKPVNRSHLKKLALLFSVKEEDLLTYWLAEKVMDLVRHENVAMKAIQLAEEELMNLEPKRRK